MPARYRVALHGFSEFERTTLAYCINHTASRVPGYVQVELIADSDFVVADASHEAIATSTVRGERLDDTLFVGDKPPFGARAHIARPLDPERILRALDRMAANRGARFNDTRPDILLPLDQSEARHLPLDSGADVETTPAAFQHEPVSVTFTDLQTLDPEPEPSVSEPAAGTALAAPDVTVSDGPLLPAGRAPAAAPRTPPTPAKPMLTEAERVEAKAAARRASRRARLAQAAGTAVTPRDVLLLEAAGKSAGLGGLLESFGFAVHRCGGMAEAIGRLERAPLAAVFLDVALDDATGMDGLDLCQRIKHRELALGGPVPAVMLLADRDSAAGRVRAKLAGCDVFLLRPVERGDAARALESCSVALPADARRG